MSERERVRDAIALLVNCVVLEADARRRFEDEPNDSTREQRERAGEATTEAVEALADALASEAPE